MRVRPPRLPTGVSFEAPAPPDGTLPRMDVVAFVGFAGRGPLDTPTPVTSAAEFAAVFGPDIALAWDAARGEPVTTHLGPAVRAYFRNGGRRCWVVRAAGAEVAAGGFDATAFVDPDLADLPSRSLALALDQRSLEHAPARGVFSLWSVDEVTVIAVPDAVHRPWAEAPVAPDLSDALAAAPAPAPPPPCRCRCCADPADAPPLRCAQGEALTGTFRASERGPEMEGFAAEVDTNLITLSWAPLPDDPASVDGPPRYVVEEFSRPDAADAGVIFAGTAPALESGRCVLRVRGRPAGVWRYRARATRGGLAGPWVTAPALRLVPPPRSELLPPQPLHVGLLALHSALIRMCRARGDLLAVLSLPDHFRGQEAVTHARRLRTDFRAEPEALSHALLLHPWLHVSDTAPVVTAAACLERELRLAASPVEAVQDGDSVREAQRLLRTPPDGAVCGILATVARDRGAWISPAGRPMAGVLALSVTARDVEQERMQGEGVNVVRRRPDGFSLLDAETLSDEPELQQVSVRRLLTLLRRVALQRGMTYAFEPHDDTLRREVRGGFESLLGELYTRGAFVGARPAEAFQVVVDEARTTVDAGRLAVELRVAPSLPLRFVRVVLVQQGGASAVTEGV